MSVDDLKVNPSVFSGKSADVIAQVLRDSGYDVVIKKSAKSKSGAQIIKINNLGGGKNVSQVQVSSRGGKHGSSPYIKISTTDQGIIKIIDDPEYLYKTDRKETATSIPFEGFGEIKLYSTRNTLRELLEMDGVTSTVIFDDWI